LFERAILQHAILGHAILRQAVPRHVTCAIGFSQEEILEHEPAVSPCQRATARTADYFARVRLRTSFSFDDVIERAAVRTSE
jgi:hypothetical protein